MKIIFVSHLSDTPSAGPNWSVPARIHAQEKIDDVLWLNATNAYMNHWSEAKSYMNAAEWTKKPRLKTLPEAFRKPDLVVFEGIYFIDNIKFAKDLIRNSIPYIINPRGSLTLNARRHYSRWKKLIAHKLFFDWFCNKALAIQYLTEIERRDSAHNWRSGQFVIPNGFSTPEELKTKFSQDEIKAIFIGRPAIYHKGIDMLFAAMSNLKDELQANGFKLLFHSPIRDDRAAIEKMAEEKGILSLIDFKGEISGKEKKEAILNSDLFVLTSRFEGHPMGLIEALAYGLPALVTTGSNMREEIEQADAGWTADSTEEGIRSALRKILKEKEKLQEKGMNARNLSLQYDWDRLAKIFHDIVSDLLKVSM